MIGEPHDKPYQSIEDWKREVRHLKWPTIILMILVAGLALLIDIYV